VLGALSVMGVAASAVTVGSSGAVQRPATPRVGTVSSPIGASVLTSVIRQNSFDWFDNPSARTAGPTQRLLARR